MERRIYFVFFLVLFFYGAVVLRLFFWQVISSDHLRSLAEKQTLALMPIPAQRGRIFAADGSPLVINQEAFLVFAEPKKLNNIKVTAAILAKELGIPEASVASKLSESGLVWLPIAHGVDKQRVDAIKKNELSGIGFIEESKRFYPEATMAAHILGFVGKNSKGDDQGYFGLEGYYNEQLLGRNGVIRQEEDALGNPILSGKLEEISAEDGRDLYLTLDKTVQFIIENKLREGVEKYQAKGGSVVVLEPTTGEILGMASYPYYDPASYSNFSSEVYKNPIIASSYEPGSTFKVLVMAAALSEGKISSNSKYNEEGPIEIGEFTINTWNQKYHGEIILNQVLEYSSNVGMVFIERQLGNDLLYRYLEFLGFGALTEVDLQEEAPSLLRPKSKWYEIDYATVSFGQGIAVTPLQMVRAVATLANSGKLMKPYLVKKIQLKDGKVISINPKVEKSVFSTETANLVSEMMVSAVSFGETKFIKPVGYRIAGKTGTAQIPVAGHYDTEKTIASFVGFAPSDSPRFIILVTLVEPTASPWGSETAAPIFFAIARELFAYYKISPS